MFDDFKSQLNPKDRQFFDRLVYQFTNANNGELNPLPLSFHYPRLKIGKLHRDERQLYCKPLTSRGNPFYFIDDKGVELHCSEEGIVTYYPHPTRKGQKIDGREFLYRHLREMLFKAKKHKQNITMPRQMMGWLYNTVLLNDVPSLAIYKLNPLFKKMADDIRQDFAKALYLNRWDWLRDFDWMEMANSIKQDNVIDVNSIYKQIQSELKFKHDYQKHLKFVEQRALNFTGIIDIAHILEKSLTEVAEKGSDTELLKAKEALNEYNAFKALSQKECDWLDVINKGNLTELEKRLR